MVCLSQLFIPGEVVVLVCGCCAQLMRIGDGIEHTLRTNNLGWGLSLSGFIANVIVVTVGRRRAHFPVEEVAAADEVEVSGDAAAGSGGSMSVLDALKGTSSHAADGSHLGT